MKKYKLYIKLCKRRDRSLIWLSLTIGMIHLKKDSILFLSLLTWIYLFFTFSPAIAFFLDNIRGRLIREKLDIIINNKFLISSRWYNLWFLFLLFLHIFFLCFYYFIFIWLLLALFVCIIFNFFCNKKQSHNSNTNSNA
jgi:hypothetical protein